MIKIELISPLDEARDNVKTVNEKTGHVVLTAADVNALPADTKIPSIEGLASEKYVNDAVANVKVDLTGYATEQYVNDAVSNVKVDLTGYATEQYVNDAVKNIDIPEVDLTGYALKTEIPDVSGYQTEAQVIALINEYASGEPLPVAEGVEF